LEGLVVSELSLPAGYAGERERLSSGNEDAIETSRRQGDRDRVRIPLDSFQAAF
jgi:hypothetical protein